MRLEMSAPGDCQWLEAGVATLLTPLLLLLLAQLPDVVTAALELRLLHR